MAKSQQTSPGAAEQLGLHMTFRISPELRERLVAAAGDRPVGEEIRRRLEASFAPAAAGSDDPRFRDLLTALARAAAVASRTDWAPMSAALGYDRPNYAAFEAAVPLLIEVFRPEGEQAKAEEWQGIAIASAAVNAMPDGLQLFGKLMEQIRTQREGNKL